MICTHFLRRPPALVIAAVLLAAAAAARAGDFSVEPVRLELGPTARTGALTIRNEGKERLAFQLRGTSWTQDAAGRDQYEDAADLVYFPRVLAVEPGKEAVVRVGVRQNLVETEKTYRLFIEELPAPGEPGSKPPAAGLTLLVRFGAPIFVTPIQPHDGLQIAGLGLVAGKATLTLRNAGNQHQVVEDIQLKGLDAAGGQAFAVTLADRYLLAGTTKQYTAAVPPASCGSLAMLQVEIRTDKASARQQVPVDRRMCQ